MDLQTARLSLALDEFEVSTPQKPSVPELSAYASVVLTDLPRSLDLPMGSFLPHKRGNGRNTSDKSNAGKQLQRSTATIDLSKAYNRVDRARLWHKLAILGVSHKLISLLKSTYNGYKETYKIGADTD